MRLSINSRLGDIAADPKGREILDNYMPGFTTGANFHRAKCMTIKMLAPLSKGMLPSVLIKRIEEDLARL